MTNFSDNRAKRCAAAIRSYDDEWDDKSNLINFLADARHWCDRNKLCFAELDRIAFEHYLTELPDQRRQSWLATVR
jgi:hypothetical protein